MPATNEKYYCDNCKGYRKAHTNNDWKCWSCDSISLVRSNDTAVALIRTEASVSSLQVTNYYLSSKREDLEKQNSNLMGLIRAGERELDYKNSQISSYSSQLSHAQNQLEATRNELTNRQNKYDDLSEKFSDLRVESDRKINERDSKIENQTVKIVNLRLSLNKSEEKNNKSELEISEDRLDKFIQELGIRRAKIRELRNAYQQFLQNHENCNRNDARLAEDKIEEIKDDLLDEGVSLENVRELRRKCEEIAKLRMERERLYQDRYEARQEVPHNNWQ